MIEEYYYNKVFFNTLANIIIFVLDKPQLKFCFDRVI